MNTDPLLEIRDLYVQFVTDQGVAQVLDGVNLTVRRGETLGLVGETGCGKSVTGLSVLRLVPEPPGRVVSGAIMFEGQDLLGLSGAPLRAIRGGRIAMIFQDPLSSLNPVYTIGDQIAESIQLHQPGEALSTWKRVAEALGSVGIADPEARAHSYPHQFSGGMRQRGVIAMMLACRPALLIADEPTTALDVTIQAQVLRVIQDLQRALGMAVLLITHNLGVVAETCDRVAVMYAGNVVEVADVETLFADPKHPYTIGLLGAIPRADRDVETLAIIEGTVPSLLAPPSGCRFHPRCPQATGVCQTSKPSTIDLGGGHSVACHLVEALE